jgi:hypothetical protein
MRKANLGVDVTSYTIRWWELTCGLRSGARGRPSVVTVELGRIGS